MASDTKQPYEIARETVKQLTSRKLAPTPDNYRAVYFEVAGTKPLPVFPAEPFKEIVSQFKPANPGQQKQLALLDYAISTRNWDTFQNALLAYVGFGAKGTGETVAAALTASSAAGSNGLAVSGLTVEFLNQIARLIEFAMPAFGKDDEQFVAKAERLVAELRLSPPDLPLVKSNLANFSHRMSFAAEDQAEIRKSLLRMLQLIVQNVGDLSPSDRWLQGQVDLLRKACEPPIALRRLDDLERRLKEVIARQADMKHREQDAQTRMRELLASFLERLAKGSASSQVYQGKLENTARQLAQAQSLEDIAPVLQEAIEATRTMVQETQATRDELDNMNTKVQAAEDEIAKLHVELDRVSAQARHDPLTGTLNRKGLDEAMEREFKASQRKGTALCVAVIDIDNFKKLNDTLGHDAGDAALTHLSSVARQTLRPQDTLARYGGEEFIVLMPDTGMEEGIAAIQRVQRELTKNIFLRDNEKVLITFSAGVAQVAAQETHAESIRRADQAMYLAKRSGKNRVVAA